MSGLGDDFDTYEDILSICYAKYALEGKDRFPTVGKSFFPEYSFYEGFISQLREKPDMYFKKIDPKEINAWRSKLSVGSKILVCSSYFKVKRNCYSGVVTSLHCKENELDSVGFTLKGDYFTFTISVNDFRLKQCSDE